jgi:hypothetical protein
MVFAAELATFGQASASMLGTDRCRHDSSVNADSIPDDLVVLTEPTQDRFVDTLPNACLHPFGMATLARHAATAAELTRQTLSKFPVLR